MLASADQKHGLVATACTLCVEHTGAVRAAFSAAAPNSGAAVLRLQCEAPLRATWLVHSATPVHMCKLGRTLDLEADQAARHLPGYLEILEAVVRKAPQGLSTPIAEFNQYSRHALNSLVHIGIHPMRRVQEGFPLETAATVVRFSNALMHLAYRILASLSGPPVPRANRRRRVTSPSRCGARPDQVRPHAGCASRWIVSPSACAWPWLRTTMSMSQPSLVSIRMSRSTDTSRNWPRSRRETSG